jgi:hypothetical protein
MVACDKAKSTDKSTGRFGERAQNWGWVQQESGGWILSIKPKYTKKSLLMQRAALEALLVFPLVCCSE